MKKNLPSKILVKINIFLFFAILLYNGTILSQIRTPLSIKQHNINSKFNETKSEDYFDHNQEESETPNNFDHKNIKDDEVISKISSDPFKLEITLHQPPPNQLSPANLWNLTIVNTSEESIEFYLEGTGSEQTEGLIVHGSTPQFTLLAGERKNYKYQDFQNGQIGWDNTEIESFITSTGTVPGGFYNICVVAKNSQGLNMSALKCITQTIIRNDPGQVSLLTPGDAEVLTSGNNLLFTWQPVIVQNSPVSYKIKIAEIIGNESPEAAITSSRPAFYEIDGISMTNHSYPISAPQFIAEKNYAWQVYATFNNQTISSEDVWKFKISTTVTIEEDDGCIDCPTTEPDALTITNQTTSSKSLTDLTNFTVKIGHFKMKILTATGSAGSLTGTGSVLVKWLKTPIAVKFENIKINTDDVVYDGIIITEQDNTPETYPVQWALNGVGSFNWTKEQVKNLDQWIHNIGGIGKLVKDFDLQQQVAANTNTPLKLPLGLNDFKGYTIAITEMKFEPTTANLNCVAAFPVNFEQINEKIALKGSSFSFSPCGPSVQTGKLGLLEDVTFTGNVPNGDTYNIVIKTEQSGLGGTNISWNCKGFEELNLDMDVVFPRTWLKPIPDNNNKVITNIKTNITNWNDWIIEASLPKCVIAGSNGMELEVTTMSYDHSDIRNPQGITFPANYPGDAETGLGFQGFYMNMGKIIFPDNFRTFNNSSQKINSTINNLIINKFGLTCNVKVENLINFPDGNISGLGASIDTLQFDILCSSLTEAYIRGKILLPISEGSSTDKSNALLYKASFATSNGFQFTIKPSGPIKAKFFSDAKLTLSNTSCLNLTINQGTTLDVKLNGDFEYGNVTLGTTVKNVSMKMNFQNLGLNYTSANNTMTFNAGQWSFASPQKFLANFPVQIKDIKFKTKSKQINEIVRAALSFSIDVSLMQDKISGKCGLSVIGAIKKDASGKFIPEYVNVELDDINVKANLSAVKLDGTIVFFNDHPKNGNGFDGSIKATFNSIQLAVDARLIMGSTKYLPNGQTAQNFYRYFYVEAKVILPKTSGIPFMSGLAFYGFGAAVWRGMQVGEIPKPDVIQVENSTQTTGTTSTGVEFEPDENIGFGFKVTAVIGTYPDPQTFNCDASLSAVFSTSGGLNKIGFGLKFWSMVDLTKRDESSVFGSATIEYVPPQKLFYMSAAVTIHKEGTISTKNVGNTNDQVRLLFLINGKTSKWYFICGTPTRLPGNPGPNKVNVLGVTAWEYLMFGNDIAQFVTNGFEPSTINGLNSVGLTLTPKQTEVPTQAATGKGFAIGVGVNFSQDKSYELMTFGSRKVSLNYGASGGFEINLSLLQYPLASSCDVFSPVGFRSWYCKGGVAAWVRGYAKVQLPGKSGACLVCCSGCDWTIADISAGLWLQGGFPNPTWVEGSAIVNVDLLDGKIKWSGNVDISYGSRCEIQPVIDNQTYTQEDATQQIRDMIISVEPESNSSQRFDPGTKIKTMYGFTPNDAFEVQERQSNGSIINKTFQVRYYASIENLGPAPMPVINNSMNNQQLISVQRNLNVISSNPTLSFVNAIDLVRSTNVNPSGHYLYWISNNLENVVAQAGTSIRYFEDTTKYKLTIKAQLWALNSNTSVWEKAKSRDGTEIKEIKFITFNTGKLQQTRNQDPRNLHGSPLLGPGR